MQDPATRDAVVVRKALLANDLRGVTEVICSRTPTQIMTFKQIYLAKFGSYLEQDLESYTSGDHKKVSSFLCLTRDLQNLMTNTLSLTEQC